MSVLKPPSSMVFSDCHLSLSWERNEQICCFIFSSEGVEYFSLAFSLFYMLPLFSGWAFDVSVDSLSFCLHELRHTHTHTHTAWHMLDQTRCVHIQIPYVCVCVCVSTLQSDTPTTCSTLHWGHSVHTWWLKYRTAHWLSWPGQHAILPFFSNHKGLLFLNQLHSSRRQTSIEGW